MKNYQLDLFFDCWALPEPNALIDQAIDTLFTKFKRDSVMMNSSDAVKKYCRLKLARKEHEIFGVLFLDSQHRLIEFKELFRGTINACNVYVREVAKEALKMNSAAVIFAHNHPSGVCEPSLQITKGLKSALGVFDIRVLDHIVVSVEGTASLADRGGI